MPFSLDLDCDHPRRSMMVMLIAGRFSGRARLLASKYRPDVDGLRAISVLAVLIFHYDLGAPGGFVGVDVFFVISGYVITMKIYAEMQRGEYTIAGFYDGRVRRILPAALLTIVTTLATGYFLLLPDEFTDLGNSAAYAAAGLANFWFWEVTGGYFDKSADMMPLLHMWSLGIEEQFYIVWPVLLALTIRFSGQSTRWIVAVLVLIIAGSFAASVSAVPGNAHSAFYLLPYRAWELALGALLAFAPAIQNRPASEALSVIGLGLIGYAIFGLTSTSAFPGANALWPCLGAALFMARPGVHVPVFNRLLSTRIPVFLGKISFSLYLWHWPLIVLGRQWAPGGVLSLPGQLSIGLLAC